MSSEVIHEVSEQRSRNMSAIKSKNTKPEIKVRKVLHSMGYRFRLHSKNLPGSPDIVLQNIKLLSLCMDVSGIGIRIASMLPLQKQDRNSGTKNSMKISIEIR